MPLLETLRRNPTLPDMDIVVAGNDEPRVPAIPGDRHSWSRTCTRWPGSGGKNTHPNPNRDPDPNPGFLNPGPNPDPDPNSNLTLTLTLTR